MTRKKRLMRILSSAFAAAAALTLVLAPVGGGAPVLGTSAGAGLLGTGFVTEGVTNGKYYKAQLDDYSKDAYEKLLGGYQDAAHTNGISIHENQQVITGTVESFYSGIYDAAFLALLYDYPQMSWLVGGDFDYTADGPVYSNGTTLYSNICIKLKEAFTDSGTASEITTAETEAKEAIDATIKKVTIGGVLHPRDKVKAIHDYICNNVAPSDLSDLTVRPYNTAYSALIKREATSAGYARAFKVLCDAYGIPCVLVSGTVDGVSHMWNYVQIESDDVDEKDDDGNKLESAWYAVDCALNDKNDNTDYLLVGSNVIGSTHMDDNGYWSGDGAYKFAYPELAETNFNKKANLNGESEVILYSVYDESNPDNNVAVKDDTYTYDGTEKKPAYVMLKYVTEYVDGEAQWAVADSTWYDVSYSNCIDPGEVTVTITPIADTNGSIHFTDSTTATYKIGKCTPEIKLENQSVSYTGSPAEITGAEVTPPDKGVQSFGDTSHSYRIKGSTGGYTDGFPTAAGAYEIKAVSAAVEPYYNEASTTAELTITPLDLSENANIMIDGGVLQIALTDDYYYVDSEGNELPAYYVDTDGTKLPAFVIIDRYGNPVPHSSYTVKDDFADSVADEDALATVTFKGNYTGTRTIEVNVRQLTPVFNVGVSGTVYENTPYANVVLTRSAASSIDSSKGEVDGLALEGDLSLVDPSGSSRILYGENTYNWTFTPENPENGDVYNPVPGTITIDAAADELDKLEYISGPDDKEYEYSDKFNPDGLIIKATYKSGLEESVDVSDLRYTDSKVTADDVQLKVEQTSLTVYYTVTKSDKSTSTQSCTLTGLKVDKKEMPLTNVTHNFRYGTASGTQSVEVELLDAMTAANFKPAVNPDTDTDIVSSAVRFVPGDGNSGTITYTLLATDVGDKDKSAEIQITFENDNYFGNMSITVSIIDKESDNRGEMLPLTPYFGASSAGTVTVTGLPEATAASNMKFISSGSNPEIIKSVSYTPNPDDAYSGVISVALNETNEEDGTSNTSATVEITFETENWITTMSIPVIIQDKKRDDRDDTPLTPYFGASSAGTVKVEPPLPDADTEDYKFSHDVTGSYRDIINSVSYDKATGEISISLNSTTSANIGNKATVEVRFESASYIVTMDIPVTIVEKLDQAAPSIEVTWQEGTTYTAMITPIEGAEYRFDVGDEIGKWSSTLLKTGIPHNTQVIAYIRMAETATHNASPEASETSTTRHGNITPVEAVAATCTTGGNHKYWYCPSCEIHYGDANCTIELDEPFIGALNHPGKTYFPAVNADCGEESTKEHWYCSTCDKYFSDADCKNVIEKDKTVEIKEHNLTAVRPKNDPSCFADGNLAYRQCNNCGKYFDADITDRYIELTSIVVPKLNHYYDSTHSESAIVEIAETPATCLADGYISHYECMLCHEWYDIQRPEEGRKPLNQSTYTLPKTGHDPRHSIGRAATCEEDGVTDYYYCNNDGCGMLFSDNTMSKVITAAQTIIHTQGHDLNYPEPKQNNSCISDGHLSYYQCQRPECKKFFLASDTETAVTWEKIYLPLLPHPNVVFVEPKAATCTEDGNEQYWICTSCGRGFTSSQAGTSLDINYFTSKATGHQMVHTKAVEATCTTAGNIEYWSCSVCGNYYADMAGTRQISEDTIIIPAGHKLAPKWSYDEHAHWHEFICEHAGDDTEGYAEHDFTEWTVKRQPTATVTGLRTRYCKVCRYEVNEEIPMLVRVGAPVFDPEAGSTVQTGHSFIYNEEITISSATDGATIYFTLDGSTPTKDSYRYTGPFMITGTTANETITIKAIACKDGVIDSTVTTAVYIYLAHNHELIRTDPREPTCTEDGCTMHWHCEGCDRYYSDSMGKTEIPKERVVIPATGHRFTDEWSYDETGHWHEICTVCGQVPKDEIGGFAEHSYGEWTVLEEPTLEKEGLGTHTCTICGIETTEEIPMLVQVATPEITPPDGTRFRDKLRITIITATEGATIYYTTDGTIPDEKSARYTGPFDVTTSATVVAIAVKDGMVNSNPAASSFINPEAPVPPKPHVHVYKEFPAKAPTCTEDGCILHWACEECGKYFSDSMGITEIPESIAIIPRLGHTFSDNWSSDDKGHWYNAICEHTDQKKDYAEHTYGEWEILTHPTTSSDGERARVCSICKHEQRQRIDADEVVAAPEIEPDDGTEFYDSVRVEIFCDTPGATIYYTLDGSDPTTSSKIYMGALRIRTTTTVKAYAVKDGLLDSAITVAKLYKEGEPTEDGSGGGGGTIEGGGTFAPDLTPEIQPQPDLTDEPEVDPNTLPILNGKPLTWEVITDKFEDMLQGTPARVQLNGNTVVPEYVIREIAAGDLNVTFVTDDTKEWTINGANISKRREMDLTVEELKSIAGYSSEGARGTETMMLRVDGENAPADLTLEVGGGYSGRFANVFIVENGERIFADNVKVDNTGKAEKLSLVQVGDYVVLIGRYSDRPGDVTNDGIANALDASVMLMNIVGLQNPANPEMFDFNGDGYKNALDAAMLLQAIVNGTA